MKALVSNLLAMLAVVTLTGCMVGPRYKTPPAITAPTLKESPPPSYGDQRGWKTAQPSDTALKGDWWTMFGDTQLNGLERQLDAAKHWFRPKFREPTVLSENSREQWQRQLRFSRRPQL